MNRPYGYRTSRAGNNRRVVPGYVAERVLTESAKAVERRKKRALKRLAQFTRRSGTEAAKVAAAWGHASVETFHSKFADLLSLRREFTLLKLDLEDTGFNQTALQWIRLYVIVCERRKIDPEDTISLLLRSGPVWKVFGFTKEEVFTEEEK